MRRSVALRSLPILACASLLACNDQDFERVPLPPSVDILDPDDSDDVPEFEAGANITFVAHVADEWDDNADLVISWTTTWIDETEMTAELGETPAEENGRSTLITSQLAPGNHTVQVRVTDSGPGIPREMQDRVFDPFFTTKAPGEGTGLGLSISHSIMRKLGGELTFRSPPGEGATFTARFPRFLPPPDEKTSEEES